MHGPDARHGIDQVCGVRNRQAERHRGDPVAQRGPHAAPRQAANQAGGRSNIICPPGKRVAHSAISPMRLVGLQVHQQALGGDEHAVSVVDLVHPAEVQRRLRAHLDPVRRRQQLAAQFDHRRQIDCEPTELVADAGGVEAVEAGLQTLGERDHGGLGMVDEVAAGVSGRRPTARSAMS